MKNSLNSKEDINWEKEFDEKFNARYLGCFYENDCCLHRDNLKSIKQFISNTVERTRREVLTELKKVLQEGFDANVEEEIFEALDQLKKGKV